MVITRYTLRNKKGQWLRGPYWRPWDDDINKAKLYANLGQARAARTRLDGAANIVRFECEPVVVDDAEYLAKALKRKATKNERAATRRAKRELERAEKLYESARRQLEQARRG